MIQCAHFSCLLGDRKDSQVTQINLQKEARVTIFAKKCCAAAMLCYVMLCHTVLMLCCALEKLISHSEGRYCLLLLWKAGVQMVKLRREEQRSDQTGYKA